MIVVADASVFIGLSSIGQLSLLSERFPDGVLIAPAVWREVVEQGRERPGARMEHFIPVNDITWVSREIRRLYSKVMCLVRNSSGKLYFHDALIALN